MAEGALIVCSDLQELGRKIATEFLQLAGDAVSRVGRFAVALSGGSTPRTLYSLLAESEYSARMPWREAHLFWTDERCVPPEHPESNYRMVQETLLSRAAVPAANIHRMKGEEPPEAAATEYDAVLAEFFHLCNGEMPIFDLILLGLGNDGHTASLFPGSDALYERKRLVLAPYVEQLKSYRLTLTLPVLNRGANVFFLVSGEDKANALQRVFAGSPELPAARVKPYPGRLVWFVDRAAASLIS